MWMAVGVDANRHVDLYDQDFPISYVFNLIGYVTSGVTFYTNAPDISPTAVGWTTRGLATYKENPIICFIELVCPFSSETFGLRKNVRTGEIIGSVQNHNFASVHPNTPDSQLDQYISHLEIDMFLMGIG
ncbi:hypothetical protein ES707_04066 [subsurface metagenome]